jgi:small subunit ribosomal protein S6
LETAVKKRLYEALFLIDPAIASDFDGISAAVKKIIERNNGDIITLKKWDERKLAYELKGKTRGTYIVVYFNGDPLKIAAIEREVNLSEQLMRVMILRGDLMTDEDINKDTPAMIEKQKAKEEQAREEYNEGDQQR